MQWHWYTDRRGSREVPYAEVQLGEHKELYVTWEYHLVHCVFMWKKLHRAVQNGWKVDNYLGNMGHTEHCGHMLLNEGIGRGALETGIRQKFPAC